MNGKSATTNCSSPVSIEARLIVRIGIREWGLPSMVMPGQIWRSEKHKTISCMVLHATDANLVTTETRKLEMVDVGEFSVMPDHWRDALWEYVQRWPSSGCHLGPFLRISEETRNRFLRELGERLVESDEIGCRHIAHDIGDIAAMGFEIVSDAR